MRPILPFFNPAYATNRSIFITYCIKQPVKTVKPALKVAMKSVMTKMSKSAEALDNQGYPYPSRYCKDSQITSLKL